MDGQEDLIVITGPTGSGKTSLALELSRSHAMEVISADSMQVYRHMDIATAKPGPREQAALPHHLIDVVNPDEEFHAALFMDLARRMIAEIRSRGSIPVVVGGTGLYIKALVYGLAVAPSGSQRIRTVLRSLIERRGIEHLEAMLMRLDPTAASLIRRNDAVRLIRSLEIIFLTGRTTSSIYASHGFAQPSFHARIACIMPDRGLLFSNIDLRTRSMFATGLLDETLKLLSMGYSPSLRSMQTLAYKHCIGFLERRIDLEEAVRCVQRDTRRYAKRQITWMRSQPDHMFFDSPGRAYEEVSSWLEELRSVP